jgi:zinc transport system permease protein
VSRLEGFLSAREIWQTPLLASLLAGAMLGALGVYVVLRRTVFVSAALTQISTVGLVLGLWLEEALSGHGGEHAPHQLVVAMAFAVVGAMLLGALRPRRLPAEAVIGGAWVAASALVVLGVSRLVHAAHDLGGMVFGNAVAVSEDELWIIAAVAVVCAAIHLAFSKEILFVSFDHETARAVGLRPWIWDALLSLTIGLAIPAAARALGALPVFAFLTLPASAALLLRVRFRTAFLLAGTFGVVAAGLGYLLSWFNETPTGATMVVVAALFLLPGAVRHQLGHA